MVVTLDAQLFYSVLSALPYLVNYPYECTEQTLNRFLSTGILSSIFNQYPAIEKMAREFSSRETQYENAGLQGNAVIRHLLVGGSVAVDREVQHVSGVRPFRIAQPVVLAFRIEVPAGGLEVGRSALRYLVEVNGMQARRQVLEVEIDANPFFGLVDGRLSNAGTIGVDQLDDFLMRPRHGAHAQHDNGNRSKKPAMPDDQIQFHGFTFLEKPTKARPSEARGSVLP